MGFHKTLFRLCVAGLLAAPAIADELLLPPILITASRVAETPEETLYSTNVVTREDIEALPARDAGEILQTLPGVQIGRNGGQGQVTSAFIRGAASDHTLVLIDGVPINSGTAGSPALQHLMPDQIERIEFVRGPASTLYGSSAIGGVVQIFTRRAGRGPTAQLTASAGSQDTRNYAANAGYGGETLYTNVTLSRRTTDGYPTRPSLSDIDRGYENDSFNGVVGGSFGPLDIELSHFTADGFVEYYFAGPRDQDTKNSLTRLAIEFSPSAHWDSRLLLGRAKDRTDENQTNVAPDLDFTETVRDYLDWQNTLMLGEQTLVAGITASWTDTDATVFATRYDESIRSVELYMQDTVEFGDSRFQIGGRAIDNQVYGRHYTWNLAFGHAFNASTRMHANLGTAFRAPSANDLYGFGGNPDFDPETSISGEIGLLHRLTDQDSLRLVAFQTEIDDLIETNIETFVTEQTEKARIRGIELGLEHSADSWRGSFDYSYMDPKNLDVDQLLARRARHTVNAALRYGHGPWWAETSLLYQSKRRDSRFSDTKLEGYTTVDLVTGYRFGRSFAISGRVQNLFDKDYELAATYPAQDRFISVELRYDYDGQ